MEIQANPAGVFPPDKYCSTRKSSKLLQQERIKSVCILDIVTGFVVFEKFYHWPSNRQPHQIGSLIQSFYQFAREVDDGNIESVNFEGDDFTRGNSKSMSTHNHRTKLETMRMLCTKSNESVVTICYDMNGSLSPSVNARKNLDLLLEDIQKRFEELHSLDLEFVRQQQEYAHKEQTGESKNLTSQQLKQLMSRFESFSETLENLKHSHFPTQVAVYQSISDDTDLEHETSSNLPLTST